MSPQKKLLVVLSCAASFVVGFLVAPFYKTVQTIDYSRITDSTHVNSNGLEIDQLNTPSNGYHTWISPKGNLYMGVWKEGQLYSGTLITDKSVYEGELSGLSPHGYGTMYYNNGNLYRGNWVAGNKEGIGLKHNRDGSMFFGHWRAGLFNTPKDVNHNVEDRVYGIDVSHYQHHHKICWKDLALYSDSYGNVYAHKVDNRDYLQPVTFVFIKATDGIDQDSCYNRHLENARKHNIIVGSYHFFTIDDDVNAQIANFTKHARIIKGDLPPVLDLECEWSKNQKGYIAKLRKHGIEKMQVDALKWLKAVENHYGIKPIIYTSVGWKKHYLNDKRFDSYEFWLARYNNVPPEKKDSWTFWQRSNQAYPSGYNKNIDVNIYNGTFKDFIKYRNRIH